MSIMEVPLAIYRALQNQLASARANGDTALAARLESALSRSTPAPPRVDSVIRSSGRAVKPVAVGDVVHIPYRAGNVIEHRIVVTNVFPDRIDGVLGGVVHQNGQVDTWWSDGARMAANRRYPLTYPRYPYSSIAAVYRNGQQIA